MSKYNQLGQRIRAARCKRGWSQSELGTRMIPPRSHAAVSDIERGKTKLDLDEIASLQVILGVTLVTMEAGSMSNADYSRLATG